MTAALTRSGDRSGTDAAPIGRPRSGEPDAPAPRRPAREPSARTYARSLPIVPARARGMTVEGADGRRYLDCLCGAGALALGHNHPVVLEALRRVVDADAPPSTLDVPTPVKERFVEELLATLPADLASDARVRFCGPDGTDAVDVALELARAATGRSGVLAFAGTRDAVRLPFPQTYRCPFGGDPAYGADAATRLTRALLDDAGPGGAGTAALILEPVHEAGGVLPAPDAWLRDLRRITTERGITLIADESWTGLGRTGAMWGVDHAGVVPDIMVISKAIGGSLPLAAVVHRPALDPGRPPAPAVPYRGNRLAMAAGTATIAFVRDHRLDRHAARVGAGLTGALTQLLPGQPAIGDVRGRGLLIGVEIVEPDGAPDRLGARPSAPRLAAAVRHQALERGLIVELGGRDDSVVRLLPPLTITDAQADAVLERLAEAIEAARAAYVPTPA